MDLELEEDDLDLEEEKRLTPRIPRYNGPTRNGQPDTTGTNELGVKFYPLGNVYRVYCGKWKNGEFDGHGILTFTAPDENAPSGEDDLGRKKRSYNGKFKNGEFDGQGNLILVNRSTYNGEFVNGELHGDGVYTFSNENTRSGIFRHDRHVEGRLVQGSQTFEGTYSTDGRPKKGTYTYPIGTLTGTAVTDTLNRFAGTFRYNDGDVYSGTFRHDDGGDWVLDGDNAKMIVNSKTDGTNFIYNGQMKDGKRHGFGKMCMTDYEWRWRYDPRSKWSNIFNMDNEDYSNRKYEKNGGGGPVIREPDAVTKN